MSHKSITCSDQLSIARRAKSKSEMWSSENEIVSVGIDYIGYVPVVYIIYGDGELGNKFVVTVQLCILSVSPDTWRHLCICYAFLALTQKNYATSLLNTKERNSLTSVVTTSSKGLHRTLGLRCLMPSRPKFKQQSEIRYTELWLRPSQQRVRSRELRHSWWSWTP